MPYSARENDADVIDFVSKYNIREVLDIGPGSGTYAKLLRDIDAIDCIEIWEPYVEEFALKSLYREVRVGDARDGLDDGLRYDLIIFGDVLEHMTPEDALDAWTEASYLGSWGLISLPIIHWPQGAHEGNPYEEHIQDHIDVDDLKRDFGPFDIEHQYEMTGTFIKRFTGRNNE